MTDVAILGGGFAGLAAGVKLAQAGRRVLVLEKKPHLGGRAYSFKDPESGESVDNGQHLFMGCYRKTRELLRAIGTEELLHFPAEIRVDYADALGGSDRLSCPTFLPSPLHLAAGVLRLRGVSLGDKCRLARLAPALRKPDWDRLDRITVRQWLDGLGQSRLIQQRFFDPIALGALNDDPEVAAATGFAQVLSEIFFKGVESTRLGLCRGGLSGLYTEAARAFIEARGGEVRLSQSAASLLEKGGRVSGVRLESGEAVEASAVLSTLPPWSLRRLGLRGPWETLAASPIVSLTLWMDRPVVDHPLVGLLGADIQWVFNKTALWGLGGSGQCLALVISGAHRHVQRDPKELLALAESDLSRCLPAFRGARVLRWKVVKEPFATLSPVPGSDAKRPPPGELIPGFSLAGDWTRTGLPATIESAVASGFAAAEQIVAAS